MLKHYLKIAFRDLFRNKFYSFINTLGLATGMGICLLIYQYIHFELSFDRFHPSFQDTYRITQSTFRNGEILSFAGTRGGDPHQLLVERLSAGAAGKGEDLHGSTHLRSP